MASIKIKFRPSAVHGKEGRLFFQVIHRRVVRQIATSHRVFECEWDASSQEVVAAGKDASCERQKHLASVRASLSGEHRLLCRVVASLDRAAVPYSADSVVNEYAIRTRAYTLGAFMRDIIAGMNAAGRCRTARNYQSALNSFMLFRGQEDIALDMIDSGVVQSYEAWLKSRGVCRNTSSFYMRILRAVYNSAVEKGVVSQARPFARVYTGTDRTRKRAVGLAVVKALRAADLGGCRQQDFARDMFLMSFFLRGISFVDLAHLRKSDLRDGYLYYTRSKTRQRLCVKWEPLMQQIVDKYSGLTDSSPYLLPIISDDGIYNKVYRNAQARIAYHLKRIAAKMKIAENLTLYVARHSWASIARSSNVPVAVISEALGHDSERTTQIYLQSIQTSEVDKANESILAMV